MSTSSQGMIVLAIVESRGLTTFLGLDAVLLVLLLIDLVMGPSLSVGSSSGRITELLRAMSP